MNLTLDGDTWKSILLAGLAFLPLGMLVRTPTWRAQRAGRAAWDVPGGDSAAWAALYVPGSRAAERLEEAGLDPVERETFEKLAEEFPGTVDELLEVVRALQ